MTLPNIDASQAPAWAHIVDQNSRSWSWRNGRVYHERAVAEPYLRPKMSIARTLMLNLVYASQNSSRSVRKALGTLLARLQPGEWAINIGAGSTRIHPQ